MRDLFYTILVIWVVWQIVRSVSAYSNRQKQNNGSSNQPKKQGETSVDYIPEQKNKIPDSEGEYVDYEEIK